MTLELLRQIATESGLRHARVCLEDEATQVGREPLAALFAELDRWENAAYENGSEEFPL
jgi:hypothetical protein